MKIIIIILLLLLIIIMIIIYVFTITKRTTIDDDCQSCRTSPACKEFHAKGDCSCCTLHYIHI